MQGRMITSCVAVVGLICRPFLIGHATAAGGTDPVYARLTASQKHTYNQLSSAAADTDGCYGSGRDAYNAYLTWLTGTQTLMSARQRQATAQRLCSSASPGLGTLTRNPLFTVSGPYHDLVMDGLLVTAAENTLTYDIALALAYDAHSATLQGEITTAALKARSAIVDLEGQRQRFRARYGF